MSHRAIGARTLCVDPLRLEHRTFVCPIVKSKTGSECQPLEDSDFSADTGYDTELFSSAVVVVEPSVWAGKRRGIVIHLRSLRISCHSHSQRSRHEHAHDQ